MTFSDKIKLSRELCNLTQQQLADKVGVSKRTIASYESSLVRLHVLPLCGNLQGHSMSLMIISQMIIYTNLSRE